MRARVIKIGNSQGLRIPKPILEQTGIMDDVEIEVEKNQIIIRPVKNVREGWNAAFKKMHQAGDDTLLINDAISHSWDEEEWQWFHDLPFDYKGIVEFICDFVQSISTPEYAATMGLLTIIALLFVWVFKIRLRRPNED